MVSIKTIKVSLSEKGLDDLIGRLTVLKYGLKEADDKIVKEMAQKVERMVADNINETPYKDGNDETVAYSEINGNKAVAGMRGRQCVYNEFGTGTKGEESPHPEKGKFNLKGYNTGPKIRPDDNGNLVWWYFKDGKYWYTNGIPAGKQVFKAANELRRIKGNIIKEKVGEVISKL